MIYFIQAEGVGHIKIGFTDADDAAVRLAALQVGSPVPLRLIGVTPGGVGDEKDLHRRFAAHRVHGEWFRPVPDLLALISPVEPLSCEGVEVVEQSVSIRVLTVGRKQFSKSLLDQLPERDVIDWAMVLEMIEENPLPAFVVGHVWGWVAGGHMKVEKVCNPTITSSFRWVVFERGGRLYKFRDFTSVTAVCYTYGFFGDRVKALRGPYYARLKLPGWRDEDQLFFGV